MDCGVKTIDKIPKNASGKILKRELKERARAEFETELRLQKGSRL